MNQGKLYGLGVGPGDSELITVKAVRLLGEADVIAAPDKGAGEKTALQIVAPYIGGKEIMLIPTPMVRDRALLDAGYERAADSICARLDRGETVAFVTLGDPAIYSTYVYIHQRVLQRGYAAELIPGVPSFCAVAARMGQSLCERSQRLTIVPASAELGDALTLPGNKIFMKAGSAILDLQDRLRRAGLLEKAWAVENCGMAGERIWEHFADMKEPGGYFCVVVVKE